MKEKKIIIVGSGLSGLFLANILAELKIHSILIDKQNIEELKNKESDGRVSAISNSNQKIIEKYNLWHLFKDNFCKIEQIRVTDNHSPLFLHFDNQLVENNPLGFMIENNVMISSLTKNILKSPYVKIIDNDSVEEFTNTHNSIIAKTTKGLEFEGEILIAANGKFSDIREKAGIKSYQFSYKQTAMVFNISHEKNHENIAQEIFMQSGPFAILPMHGGHMSAIVWTEKTALAELYLKMNKKDFHAFLMEKITDYLGEVKIVSKIISYPLSISFSREYYKNRICLVGDSAHSIHPIAGQGFNQTIRDIDVITSLIAEHKSLGLDIGSKVLLAEYQRTRKIDNYAMLAITDSLNRLFSNDSYLIAKARRLGLSAINHVPYFKKFFMKYAMGDR